MKDKNYFVINPEGKSYYNLFCIIMFILTILNISVFPIILICIFATNKFDVLMIIIIELLIAAGLIKITDSIHCFDFRKYRGIGNYTLDCDEYNIQERNNYFVSVKFPFTTKKSEKIHTIEAHTIPNSEVKRILLEEIYPALINLYKKADISKETRALYPGNEIKILYNTLNTSIENIKNAQTNYILNKEIKMFIKNKDEILKYIQNISKPIDDLIDKKGKNETQDPFLQIKNMNKICY
jgi:hypothetical protein